MRVLFDVNVLIALFDPAHIHHETAHTWWDANRRFGWASCPITQNGFVRILSQPKYPNTVSTPDAIRRLRHAMEHSEHVFWPDSVSVADAERFQSERILGPKQVTDLYLLSLAVTNSGRLATFDRAVAVSAVISAKPQHLVVI